MRHKKKILVPFGVMALLAIFAATAFACTIFRGTFTIKGNASSTSVTATGSNTGMTQTVSSGVAKATLSGGSVTLWTGADAYGRKLPAKTYYVRYYNSNTANTDGNSANGTDPGYDKHTHWYTDCMVGAPWGKTLGTVSVGTDGKIAGQPKTFSLGTSTNKDVYPEESAVCISDNGAAYGNQAPLTIL